MGWFFRTPAAPHAGAQGSVPPTVAPVTVGVDAFRALCSRVELLEDDLTELHKRYRRLLGSVTKSEALARGAEEAGPAVGPALRPSLTPLRGGLTRTARQQLKGG